MRSFFTRDRDFYQTLYRLSLPLLLQNLLNQSLQLFDTFMVGALGEKELAAVTLANTPFFIMMLIVFGLQSGSSVLFSQYWGKRDTDTISRIIGIGSYISGGITFMIAMTIFIFPEGVMSLTTNDPALIAIAARYGRIVAFSYFINSFAQIYIAAQRSMEHPKLGLYILGVSMVINTFLNWVLIFGNLGAPKMGVEGAALATVIARFIELAITVVYAARCPRFHLKLSLMLRPGKTIFMDFIRYSLPVVLNETLWGTGFSIYPVIIGHMENASVAVSAFTITGNIERILSVFIFALGNAAAIMVGNHLGSGESVAGGPDRAFQMGARIIRLSAALGIAIGVILCALNASFITPVILPLFNLNEAASLASVMLYITAAGMPFRALNATGIVGVLRGGGDVHAGLVLDVCPMYLFGLPAAVLFGLVAGLSVVWVCIAMGVEEIIKSVFVLLRVRSGKWVRNVTREMEAVCE